MNTKKETKNVDSIDIAKIIEWCDKVTENGDELCLYWEGGGDSGWLNARINGDDINSVEADWLIEELNNTLDYGSWAGEFSANGEAVYNRETKTFDGENYYSETEGDIIELDEADIIQIKIPTKYTFDTLHVSLDDAWDGADASITPRVRDGFMEEELLEHVESLEKKIGQNIRGIFDNYASKDKEIVGNWQTETFTVDSSTKIEDGNYVFEITEITYSYENTDASGISIDLNDYL
jgi:hypothetical protein